MPIKNVILDLGGVLYAINYGITRNELEKLAENPIEHIEFSREQQEEIFDLFDKGKITSQQFRDGLRNSYKLKAEDHEINRAWNAMLLHVIPEALEIVKHLAPKVRLVLLSNTNELHIAHIKDECRELFSHFEKLYYSYEMGMRKPNADIYEEVLKDRGFIASETLFVDDAPANVEGAIAVGIRGYRIDDDHPLLNVLAMVGE
ncbi:MAG: HAD family phosphatase [Bacteroidota bacterium]